MLAEYLDWPLVNVATSIEGGAGGSMIVCRDMDGGREKLEVNLPAVITCQKELTEPRIPNMRGIMAARTKPLQVLAPQGKGVDMHVLEHALPPSRQACQFFGVHQMDELVEALHQQAKVL
jgi:electron transfer flavoprotein beta subunit